MTASTFFIPSVNVIGNGALKDAMNTMKDYGYRRALIVTDAVLNKLGVAADIQKRLQEYDILSVVFDGTHPNPTTVNVEEGLEMLRANDCDCVISLGGGSRMTARKGSRWSLLTAAIFVIMKALTVLLSRSCR